MQNEKSVVRLCDLILIPLANVALWEYNFQEFFHLNSTNSFYITEQFILPFHQLPQMKIAPENSLKVWLLVYIWLVFWEVIVWTCFELFRKWWQKHGVNISGVCFQTHKIVREPKLWFWLCSILLFIFSKSSKDGLFPSQEPADRLQAGRSMTRPSSYIYQQHHEMATIAPKGYLLKPLGGSRVSSRQSNVKLNNLWPARWHSCSIHPSSFLLCTLTMLCGSAGN